MLVELNKGLTEPNKSKNLRSIRFCRFDSFNALKGMTRDYVDQPSILLVASLDQNPTLDPSKPILWVCPTQPRLLSRINNGNISF